MVTVALYSVQGRRLLGLAKAALVGLLPIATWLVFLRVGAGSVVAREVSYHPPDASDLKVPVHSLTEWFAPPTVPPLAKAIVVGCAITALATAAVVRYRTIGTIVTMYATVKTTPIAVLAAAYAVLHVAVVLVSIAFLDTQTTPNSRIMYPVFVCGLLAVLATPRHHTRMPSVRANHAWPKVVVLAALVVTTVWTAALEAIPIANGGTGFGSPQWTASELMDYIRQLPNDAPVFQTLPTRSISQPLGLLWSIPSEYYFWSLLPNANLEAEVAAMARELAALDGAVVIFTDIERDYLMTLRSLQQLPIEPALETADGVLFVSR